MLRCTVVARKSYRQRILHVPHRYKRIRHVMPGRADKNPLRNKNPEEYKDNEFLRTGVDAAHRKGHVGYWRNWPWVSKHDDPIGAKLREDGIGGANARTFSVAEEHKLAARTRYNPYENVGKTYNVSSEAPLLDIVEHLYVMVARAYSEGDCRKLVEFAQQHGWRSPADVAANPGALVRWSRYETPAFPVAVAEHIEMLCEDLVRTNEREAYRQRCQTAGVLRTRNMEQYYTLPPLVTGPVMPQALAQPGHKCRMPYRFGVNAVADPVYPVRGAGPLSMPP